MFQRSTVWAVILALLVLPGLGWAQDQFVDPNTLRPSRDPNRTANGLALTPPMGWNSWNKFGCNVDERIIRDAADAMVSSGMKDAGYQYVIIDDCWHGARDENGFITEDRTKFPSGMKALADYVHSRGLKFGLYSDAGAKTCAGRPGSQGHEYQDALTYARWGVDYLKYDWCNTGSRNAEEAYALMADALRSTGRPVVLAICEWGNNRPWEWATRIGNLWRTTADIRDAWSGRDRWMIGVVDIVDINEPLHPYAGPGHWNDPDMLEVGNGGMTTDEYRAHFSLWAMMAAPLVAGNDLANMDEATRSILMNTDVIAVDQDALGRQGRRVRKTDDEEVWVRELADGARAVLLFNRSPSPRTVSTTWAEIGLSDATRPQVRDLWAHRSVKVAGAGLSARTPAHGVAMYRVTP